MAAHVDGVIPVPGFRRHLGQRQPAGNPDIERQSVEAAKETREELLEQTRRDIEAETRRAIQEIRKEVADLTVAATEAVTRKTLNEDDQRRLVEEALSELDFSALGERR